LLTGVSSKKLDKVCEITKNGMPPKKILHSLSELHSIYCFSESYLLRARAVNLRAGLLGVGTYISTSPAPENIKVPLSTVIYIAGMLGFAIREALWGQAPTPTTSLT
jgi:hypothetical protein